MDVRELRLWHYRRALSAKQTADQFAGHSSGYSANHHKSSMRLANFHFSAVDALNQFCTTRVDVDHHRFHQPHSTRKKT